jgi:hypothetical protein
MSQQSEPQLDSAVMSIKPCVLKLVIYWAAPEDGAARVFGGENAICGRKTPLMAFLIQSTAEVGSSSGRGLGEFSLYQMAHGGSSAPRCGSYWAEQAGVVHEVTTRGAVAASSRESFERFGSSIAALRNQSAAEEQLRVQPKLF